MSETKTTCTTTCGECEANSPSTATVRRWVLIAVGLVAGTMIYNIGEAVIATVWGRKAESMALFGFGLDSIIECAAASIMLWRLVVQLRGVKGEALERSERSVRRFIGGTFLALVAYLVVQAGLTLWRHEAPNASRVGIMPTVSFAKLRVARELGSRALRAEAKETLVCSYLSFTLLVGLGANAVAGWWWADPVAALVMVPWLIKEGREGIRGDECCDDD